MIVELVGASAQANWRDICLMKPVMLNGLFVPREPTAGFRLWECKAVLEYQRSLQNGRGPVLVFQPVRLRANCQQLRAEFREEMARHR